jgi:hypothetical protein
MLIIQETYDFFYICHKFPYIAAGFATYPVLMLQ